jgi:hypothetical protein
MPVNLRDTGTILEDAQPKKMRFGYMKVLARAARTGVQKYKGYELDRPDLEDVMLYRPPSEVFNRDSMGSLSHMPITLTHPDHMVDATTWGRDAVGHIGEDIIRDGEHIRIPLMLCDQAAIDAYEKHGVRELSVGYSTDIEWKKGKTPEGVAYDAIQRNIRCNHLALVPAARGGSTLRIGDRQSPHDAAHSGQHRRTLMGQFMIDRIPVELSDRDAAVVERHLVDLNTQLKAAKDACSSMEEDKKKKDDTYDALKKVSDAQVGEIAVLKKQIEDSKITPAKLDELVKARMGVIDRARTLLPENYVFDGKEEAAIRRDAVATKLGDAVTKTLTDAQIEGAFLAAAPAATASGTERLATGLGDAMRFPTPGGGGDLEKARQLRDQAWHDRNKDLENAWKGQTAQRQ